MTITEIEEDDYKAINALHLELDPGCVKFAAVGSLGPRWSVIDPSATLGFGQAIGMGLLSPEVADRMERTMRMTAVVPGVRDEPTPGQKMYLVHGVTYEEMRDHIAELICGPNE